MLTKTDNGLKLNLHDDKDIVNAFMLFLRNLGVYHLYKLRSDDKEALLKKVEKFNLDLIQPVEAFTTWQDTQEGDDFWAEVNHLWTGFLDVTTTIKDETIDENFASLVDDDNSCDWGWDWDYSPTAMTLSENMLGFCSKINP